ncbi:MAG: M14 family zinc carboxypeptidase, partial [Bacteroidota bacterium]
MRSFARLCLSLIVVLASGVAPAALQAQDLPLALDVPTPPGVTGYDPAIPTPEEVLGHELGMKHTVPLEVVRYFEAVAAVSDRVVMAEYGRTYEGRPLIYTVVTSPSNHARLETIRQQNLRLSDAPDEVSDADLGAMPVVVFHAFGVHGNEPSTTDSALLYLYHLAAGQGPGVEDALEDAVLIIDPMLNPDGRDRFADWVNRHNGPVVNPDPQHTEHSEPWPGGRTNHYWFDLNRDWLPLAHPESQGRVELYHAWRPQVLTDHHEMGSNATYFFMPGIPSRVNPNTPTINQELTAQIGAFHAQYLDEIGALYYSKESF